MTPSVEVYYIYNCGCHFKNDMQQHIYEYQLEGLDYYSQQNLICTHHNNKKNVRLIDILLEEEYTKKLRSEKLKKILL